MEGIGAEYQKLSVKYSVDEDLVLHLAELIRDLTAMERKIQKKEFTDSDSKIYEAIREDISYCLLSDEHFKLYDELERALEDYKFI